MRGPEAAAPRRRRLPRAALLLAAVVFANPALAASGGDDGLGKLLVALIVIIAGARLTGALLEAMGQPAVLGELLFGIALGNLPHLGITDLAWLADDRTIQLLAELGVLLLLFEVGLESNVSEMLAVGASSLSVAVVGVLVPLALGYGVATWMRPAEPALSHLFVGATLAATSVGITARVLADLGQLQAPEARIVLGAAVIDDVLGLVLLAVVSGSIVAADQGAAMSVWSVLAILGKALAFLLGAIVLGSRIAPAVFRLATRLHGRGLLLATTLVLLFAFSWLAQWLGLAAIVGAFAAGLILDEVHYQRLALREKHAHLESLIQPLSGFLVPIFFVSMGLGVDVAIFADTKVLAFAGALTLAAIVGKLASGAGVLERGVDRLTVAIGMVPRGEVGLIFAGIGAKLTVGGMPVVGPELFSGVVMMVMVTTLLTPPALGMSFARLASRTRH